MTLEELDRAAIARFNKPYKQLSNADKKTLKELDQKKREAQLDYALRVRQVRPEIPDDLMKDLIYKVYRSKVKLSPTGRWIEGQVAPIRGGLNELRLRLTGQAYIKGKTAGKGKKKHDVEGDYFTGRGGQYYGQYSAAQMGVTKYHIRKIEREMGISFEGQSKKVIELLEAGAIKGRKHGDVEAKVDSSLWTKLTPEQQIAYEQTGIYPPGSWQRIWTDAIEQRTLGDRINKRLLDSEVVKRDGGVLQLPDHLVTNQTRLVRAKIWKEKLFDEFERHGLRKKAGERPETATEATNDILNKYTRMKQAEMSFEERGRLVQKAEEQLWNLGDRRTKTNKAIPTGSLKRKDVDGTTFWNPPRLQETYFNPFHQDNEFGLGKYVSRGQLAEILKKQKDLLQGDKKHVFDMTEIYERTAHLNPTDYGAFLVSTWRMTDAQKIRFFGSVKDANKIVEFAHKKGIKDKDWQSAKKKIDDDRAKSDSAQKMVEPEERVDDSVGKSSDQEQKKAAREQYESTIDKMNEGMQFKMSEFFPYYDWVRFPATTGLPFRTPQPQETFNPFTNEAFATPEFTGITPAPSSQPTVIPQQPNLGVYGGLDPFKSKTPDFIPPDLTYSSGVTPISMPDITSGMNLASRSIQSDMSALGGTIRLDQVSASRLVQSQTVAQKLTQMQIQRQQMVQKTRQQFRMKPMTRLATEPFVPRTVPRPPTFPMFFPPFDTMRPRRKPKKKIKKDKTRIWWDVPSQPLGEAWAAEEYVVFKGKVEPAKVQKKERKKKLDYHETFVEPQEYTESFYSDKGAKNFGEV